MPSRVVRGEINRSHSLSRVQALADLTFRALLVAVDDYGRMEAHPLILKASLFPLRREIEPEQVRAWVDELAAEGCVRVYAVAGVEYLELTGWDKHRSNQRRAARSRYPGPDEASEEILGDPRKSPRLASDDSSLTTGECRVTRGGVRGDPAPAAPARDGPRSARKARVSRPEGFPPPELRAELAREFVGLDVEAGIADFLARADEEGLAFKSAIDWEIALFGVLAEAARERRP